MTGEFPVRVECTVYDSKGMKVKTVVLYRPYIEEIVTELPDDKGIRYVIRGLDTSPGASLRCEAIRKIHRG